MHTLAVAVIIISLPVATAQGQWRIGLEVATARYGGSARDTANGGGPPTFRPGDATMVGLRLERVSRRLGVAVRASIGTPGIAGSGTSLTISDKSTGQLIEVATLVAVRVGGIGPSGVVRAELGPALHLWNVDERRRRIGALGALAYEWPVAGRLSGAMRLEGTVSESWFDQGDLPPEYDLRLTWRYGVTLGLRYRL
jgi:hypothetical protein